jgi:hypothetical protein
VSARHAPFLPAAACASLLLYWPEAGKGFTFFLGRGRPSNCSSGPPLPAAGRGRRRLPNRNFPLTAAYGGGVFVGAAWKGQLLRSTDGVDWREVKRCERHVEAVVWGTLGGTV